VGSIKSRRDRRDCAWKAAEIVAHKLVPGSSEPIGLTYRAVKIIRAADGASVGDGFIFQVGLAGIPGTGLCLVFRIREATDDNPWPDISIGVDINFLEQLETGTSASDRA
jgi:hypothetical protein